MHYLVFVIPALIVGYYLLSFILALAEKDYLRHDMIPSGPPPETWKSSFLEAKQAEAAKIGLIPCGDYQTGPHSSMVKGYMRLYLTEERTALVALVSARLSGLEIKKALIRTRLSERRTLETNDCAGGVDPTGGTERTILWAADLADLLATHEARLQAENPPPAPISPTQAFALYEQIEVDRGQRMVDRKLAKWTDPSRSTIRRTIKGAFGTLRANKEQTDAIVKREKQRIEAAKLKKQ
jgi:hypothetical protein